jgi:hypothetical protein
VVWVPVAELHACQIGGPRQIDQSSKSQPDGWQYARFWHRRPPRSSCSAHLEISLPTRCRTHRGPASRSPSQEHRQLSDNCAGEALLMQDGTLLRYVNDRPAVLLKTCENV